MIAGTLLLGLQKSSKVYNSGALQIKEVAGVKTKECIDFLSVFGIASDKIALSLLRVEFSV